MPIYIIRCTECAKQVEVIIPMTSDLPRCTACGEATEKVPAVSNPHFKGSGWTPKGRY